MKRLTGALFAVLIIAGVGLVLTPQDANSWDYLRFLYQWKAMHQGGETCAGGSDGSLGNHSTANEAAGGGQCTSTCSTNYYYYSLFTPDEDGTISYGHAAVYSCAASYRFEIRANDGTLLAYGAEHEGTNASSAPWNTSHDSLTVVGGGSLCLVSGTTYKIGVWIEADPWSSPVVAGSGWGSGTGRYTAMTAYDSTWDGTGTQSSNGYPFKVSANNSADAF